MSRHAAGGAPARDPAAELRLAVARLADARRIRLVRDPVVDSAYAAGQPAGATTRYTTVPSLLDQLADAARAGDRTGGSAAGGAGPRPPADTDALALSAGMYAAARAAAVTVGALTIGRSTAELLRAAAASHWPDPGQLAAAAETIGQWQRTVEAFLARRLGEEGRIELRGIPCPHCAVAYLLEDRPGEQPVRLFPLRHDRRAPAQGGGFRGIRCDACGREWIGLPGIAELGGAIRQMAGGAAAEPDRLDLWEAG